MKKIAIGLIIFFCVISLVFNYAVDFDYTYTGEEYGVDFETPTKLNASKIKGSFDSVYHVGNSVVSFVSKAIDFLFADYSIDNVYIKELQQRSIKYIDETYPGFWHWVRRRYLKNMLNDDYLALFFVDDNGEQSKNPESSHSAVYGKGWEETAKDRFGWTFDDCYYIHNYFLSKGIWHTYNGVVYAGS